MMTQKEIDKINNLLFNPSIFRGNYLHLSKLKECLKKEINTNLKGRDNLKILDIGCGTKPYFSLFEKYKKEYIGIDMVEKKTVDIVSKAEKLPFLNNSFDVCFSTQTLEHVLNPQKSVDEIFRVLKKDGIVFLTTHGIWEKHDDPDYWRFTDESLKMLFKNFRKVKVINSGSSVLATMQIINLFLSKLFKRPFSIIVRPFYLLNNIIGKYFDRFGNSYLVINYLVVAKK